MRCTGASGAQLQAARRRARRRAFGPVAAQVRAPLRSRPDFERLGGALMRRVGPWLPRASHRPRQSRRRLSGKIRRGDRDDSCAASGTISAASPPSSPISTDLRDGDPVHRRASSTTRPATVERFKRLRDDGKPALIFAAHLANWELPAVVAAADGLDTVVLYRRPNMRLGRRRRHRHSRRAAWARWSPTGLDAPIRARPRAARRADTSACWSISTTAAASR